MFQPRGLTTTTATSTLLYAARSEFALNHITCPLVSRGMTFRLSDLNRATTTTSSSRTKKQLETTHLPCRAATLTFPRTYLPRLPEPGPSFIIYFYSVIYIKLRCSSACLISQLPFYVSGYLSTIQMSATTSLNFFLKSTRALRSKH